MYLMASLGKLGEGIYVLCTSIYLKLLQKYQLD